MKSRCSKTASGTGWRLITDAFTLASTLIVLGSFGVGNAVSSATVPTMEQIRNLTFRGIYEDQVRLDNGRYQGEPFVAGGASRPTVELAEGLGAVGQLEGLDETAVAVFLTEDSGGSGRNIYLAVVAEQSGTAENVATGLIGDRVGIRALRIEQGRLVVDLVVAGPDEPACCPTQKRSTRYRLENGTLVAESSEDMGPLSLADLEGVTWKLSRWSRGEPVVDNVEVTAAFETGNVSGRSGCNRYFGAIAGAAPDELEIGPLGVTKMLCPEPLMAVESRFLGALESATRYGFVMGRLAFTYLDDNVPKTLLLEAN